VNQPSFTTERLRLRPRTLDDLDALCAMDADPEVMRHIMGGSLPEPISHRAKLVERIAHDFGDGLGIWTAEPRDAPGRFLGWAALHPLPGWEPEVEIGWRFARVAWGHGYATEAAHALMDQGFATLGLPRIVAVLDPANARSRRVCEKLGMEERGTRHAYGAENALYVRERG